MKEWEELEDRYQDMKKKDPTSAEKFKKEMTTVRYNTYNIQFCHSQISLSSSCNIKHKVGPDKYLTLNFPSKKKT